MESVAADASGATAAFRGIPVSSARRAMNLSTAARKRGSWYPETPMRKRCWIARLPFPVEYFAGQGIRLGCLREGSYRDDEEGRGFDKFSRSRGRDEPSGFKDTISHCFFSFRNSPVDDRRRSMIGPSCNRLRTADLPIQIHAPFRIVAFIRDRLDGGTDVRLVHQRCNIGPDRFVRQAYPCRTHA